MPDMEPITREEKYLSIMAGDYESGELPKPITRKEKYYAAIVDNMIGSGGGGEGGTTNYNALTNKPSINGVQLSGNKTSKELGIDASGAASEPHNYAFDGIDLTTVFKDADELYNAYINEDYSKIHVGDYWPVTLNGTFRDYGTMTLPQGMKYYTDTNLQNDVGDTDKDYAANPVSDSTFPCCHKPYCEVTISSVKYYCAYDDCLDYSVKTLTNALMKFEVAGINQYWRYGDNGANNFQNGRPHLLMSPRDGLPITLKMRKLNDVWEGQHIDEFTADGVTLEFTISGAVGTIGNVFVDGVIKTYNTHYTYTANKITFKSGQHPQAGQLVQIEWMDGTSPWNGSAIFRTFNDPDYGILALIRAADPRLYAHIYVGNNGKGMRQYAETRTKTNQQGVAWVDRGILFMPMEDEIWGRFIHSSNVNATTNLTQWPIYAGGRRHFAKGTGNAAYRNYVWCASSTGTTTFALVDNFGNPSFGFMTSAYVAAPCFLLS